MRRAWRSIFSRQGAAALLLLVLLPAESASLALAVKERHCECEHDSCPMRAPSQAAKPAAEAGPPSCHGAGASHAAQPESGPSPSIRSTCGCGQSHSPAAPHRDSRAVLEPILTALSPLPAGALRLPGDPTGLSVLRDPESPPPKFPFFA